VYSFMVRQGLIVILERLDDKGGISKPE